MFITVKIAVVKLDHINPTASTKLRVARVTRLKLKECKLSCRYFGCIRHGRCCCMCCYNKAGRCCCACSCCDGYIDKEDEEMIICKLTILFCCSSNTRIGFLIVKIFHHGLFFGISTVTTMLSPFQKSIHK